MIQQALVVFLPFASVSNVQAQTREAATNKESLVKDVLNFSNSQRLFDSTHLSVYGFAHAGPEHRKPRNT